jgi:hypothetical protein
MHILWFLAMSFSNYQKMDFIFCTYTETMISNQGGESEMKKMQVKTKSATEAIFAIGW